METRGLFIIETEVHEAASVETLRSDNGDYATLISVYVVRYLLPRYYTQYQDI